MVLQLPLQHLAVITLPHFAEVRPELSVHSVMLPQVCQALLVNDRELHSKRSFRHLVSRHLSSALGNPLPTCIRNVFEALITYERALTSGSVVSWALVGRNSVRSLVALVAL